MNRSHNTTWVLAAVLMALSVPTLLMPETARAERYEIEQSSDSKIVFVSKAPLETFEGKTPQVSGWLEIDPTRLQGTVSLEVEVDLASFDTGKKKRNQHMRDNHLETEKYPKAWFRGSRVASCSRPDLVVGSEVTLTLQGSLDLHGVERTMECEVVVKQANDGSLYVTTSFPVKLSDHNIERPKFLVMKLSDEQQVKVKLKTQPAR